MRKVILGCVALAVVGAAGAYLVADYGCRHPETLAGRCATAAGRVGASLNPFAILGEAASGRPQAPVCRNQQHEEAQQDEQEARPQDEGDDELAGHVAAAIEDEPMEVIDVEAAPASEAIVAQVGTPFGHDLCEPETTPVELIEETSEPIHFAVEESEMAEPTAISTITRMPYAHEDLPATSESCESTGSCTWLWQWLCNFEAITDAQIEPASGASSSEETAAPADETQPATGDEPSTEGSTDETQTQAPTCPSTYHERGCPYTGSCPYSSCPEYYHSAPTYTQDEAAQGTQPRTKKVRKHKCKKVPMNKKVWWLELNEQTSEKPSGVDTMEYRPSDGDEHAFDDLQF
jgi:hypothetical protein